MSNDERKSSTTNWSVLGDDATVTVASMGDNSWGPGIVNVTAWAHGAGDVLNVYMTVGQARRMWTLLGDTLAALPPE